MMLTSTATKRNAMIGIMAMSGLLLGGEAQSMIVVAVARWRESANRCF